MNACGHHHVGHIGLLGLEKNGEESYQVTIGGSDRADAALGSVVGPAVAENQVVAAVDRLIDAYLAQRRDGEDFPATFRRVGMAPFKEALYVAR